MAKALVIKSSVFSGQGESSKLVDHTIATLKQEIPGIEIIERDLGLNPIDHLSGATTAAFFAENPAELSDDQQAALALSNTLIDELKSVDYLVLGVPMYNFGIPSTLKAWIDHVARAGVTFRYTENGPEGLVSNVKKTIITAARGGLYKGTPKDTQTNYMKDVLGFLGIDTVEFAYAEALSMGEKESSVKQAQEAIDAIVEAL